MARTYGDIRNRTKNREHSFAVRKLWPLVFPHYRIRRSVTHTISFVLPITTAEHLIIAALPLQHGRTLHGMPAHPAFFFSFRIIDLPVILSTRDGPRIASQS